MTIDVKGHLFLTPNEISSWSLVKILLITGKLSRKAGVSRFGTVTIIGTFFLLKLA